ncbi:MAG: AAA family ATPase [Candidatus Dormibacteraeota bacterium]|nr:AAA family ATPase [Candidatus Dormibacteraeota bacterium]
MRPILCPVLVGREAELDDLRSRLRSTADGRGGVLVISGEAGAGKSRLVRELRQLAEGRGMRSLAGRAVETSTPIPWRPIAEALAEAVRLYGLPADEALQPYLPALEALLPGLGRGTPASGESAALFACEGLVRLLGSLARRDGLLIVLEDLHWSDPETMAAVEYLADNLGALPVLCAATVREGEAWPAVDGFGRLRDRRAVETQSIGALSASDIERLVREALGAEIPAALAQVVHERSDGLPLLAEEVLADLATAGSLQREATGWTFSGAFPRLAPFTVPELVRRRLAALAPEDRAVVQAAAVLGRRFDWRLLSPIVGAKEKGVLVTLRRCVDVQLIRVVDRAEAETFEFRHALTREAVLAGLLPPERARLAGTAAGVIAARQPDLPGWWCELCADLLEMAGDAEGAARLLLKSARRALERGAIAAAQVGLDRAHDLAGDEELLAEVESAITECAALAGDPATAIQAGTALLARLRRLDASAGRLAAVHLRLARAHLAGGSLADAQCAVAEAAAASDAPAIVAEARLLSAQIVVERRDVKTARALAESALEVAESAGRPEIACEALAVIGRATRASSLEASEAALRRGLEMADSNDLQLWRLRCLQELGVTDNLRNTGIRYLPEARELAVRLGDIFTLAAIDLQISVGLCFAQPVVALEAAERGIETSRRFHLRLLPILLVEKALVLVQLSRSDEAETVTAEAESLAPDDVDIAVGADAYVRGYALLARDDLDGAIVRFERGVQRMLATGPTNPYPFCGIWALIRVVRGDLSGPIAEALPPFALVSQLNSGHVLLAEAVRAGRAGCGHEAEQLVAAGVPPLAAAPWAHHHAYRILSEAAIVDGWGRPVEWLHAAAAYFDGFGHGAIASACRALLRRAGVPLPRAGRGDSAVPPSLAALGITSREMDVLHLVADGLTNRNVAARLYLSEHTVETHVGSLLAKTGSSRRAQLVALVARIPDVKLS